MAQRGALTCSHGHPWSRANTRRDRNGHRQCIACERRRSRQCRARRRARTKPVEQHERHASRPSKRPGRAVAAVMCDAGRPVGHSHTSQVAVTRFDSVAAAAAFAAQLPCENPYCAQLHILAWRERGGQLGGVRIFGQPAPPPLAEDLQELYPRAAGPEPVAWAAPSVLNRPLPPPRGVH